MGQTKLVNSRIWWAVIHKPSTTVDALGVQDAGTTRLGNDDLLVNIPNFIATQQVSKLKDKLECDDRDAFIQLLIDEGVPNVQSLNIPE